MGVLKDIICIASQEFSEDNNSDDEEMFLCDTESVESITVQLGTTKKVKKIIGDKPQDFFTERYYRFGERVSKRRQRIINNNKFLIQLGQNLDGSSLDQTLSVEDFMDNNYSAFTLIYSAIENYEAWDEFINLSEEDQEKILNFIQSDNKLDPILEDNNEDTLCNIEANIESNQNINFMQNVYNNAKHQYLKIDNHIRDIFNKKKLPAEKLLNIENELRDYFNQYPNSSYRKVLDNSYQRLLIHGICKYLDLNSKSESCQPKVTIVKNNRKRFKPPSLYLVEYLGKNVKDADNLQSSSCINSSFNSLKIAS